MRAKANYTEPCTCGYKLEEIIIRQTWRILSWECPKCGKDIASTMLSDSTVNMEYATRRLMKIANNELRKEKGLDPKQTTVTFYDDNGNRIYWKDIKKENARWENRQGALQRIKF